MSEIDIYKDDLSWGSEEEVQDSLGNILNSIGEAYDEDEDKPLGLIDLISVSTFEEAALLTRNKGIVLRLKDKNGKKRVFHLTIVEDRHK